MGVLARVQQEQKAWQEHNFPGRPEWVPLIGMFEEAGELIGSYEKNDIIEIKDAIGDIMIYLCDFATGQQIDLEELYGTQDKEYECFGFVDVVPFAIGRIAHAYLKQYQKIRMHENHPLKMRQAIAGLMYGLERNAKVHASELMAIVESVWAKVSKRDWQANRDKAHLICPGIFPTEGELHRSHEDLGPNVKKDH